MNRKVLLLLCVSIAAVVGGVGLLSSDDRTYYQGRSLSQWVDLAGRDDAGSEQAKASVRAIGTNAVPTLLRWIRSNALGGRWRSRIVLHAFPGDARNTRLALVLSGMAAGNRRIRAVDAFDILGTNAASAVPELMILSRDTNHPCNAFYAINALSLLGPPAYPSMAAALSDTNRPYRGTFARNFPNLAPSVGTNRCQACLEGVLLDAEPWVRASAAHTLAELGCQTNAPVAK